jgi:hypothetical protein
LIFFFYFSTLIMYVMEPPIFVYKILEWCNDVMLSIITVV